MAFEVDRQRPVTTHWDTGHPYCWRTWIRTKLPWFLVNLGVAAKGEDCARVGGQHWWYNRDNVTSRCYHCEILAAGQLWKDGADTAR